MAYAQTIYSIFVLNQLQQLSLRIWNDGNAFAAAHFSEIQRLLDRLNDQSGSNVFVRTAPWLLQTAQGPLTRLPQPYFIVAEHISESLEDDQRLPIHRAGALLAGGHLRSQLRYRATEKHGLTRTYRSIDDPEILSVTRNSNSMDVALLIRDLIFLLEAYKNACRTDVLDSRMMLSDAILQGLSADPELLLTRLDVLGPATMIEDVFIEPKEDGGFRYTDFGDKHLEVLSKYRDLISDLAAPLKKDAQHFDPTRSAYSPFGIVYGFCADILSNIAIAKLTSPETLTLTLEDMFSSGDDVEHKLARARQWEALPRHNPERARFEYSAEWGAEIFSRLVTALGRRAMHGALPNASGLPSARVFAVQEGHSEASGREIRVNEMARAQEHCVTSDLKRALETGATAFPKSQILSDRKEGRFLASVESEGKWFAVSKVLLTTHVCQGKDALITDVPVAVIEILRLTCPVATGAAHEA